MIERKFIEDNIKSLELEQYFKNMLIKADYSHTTIKITPLSTKITIHVGKPGMAIGKGGSTIKKLTQTVTDKYKIENPQLDIQGLEKPDLDAYVIANGIADGLERRMKPGRLINIYLRKIMGAGAVGAEITISGKISGSRGRTEKVLRGYIKKCGDMAEENVDKGEARAVLKQGAIGIKVKILPYLPKSLQIEKEIKKLFSAKKKKEDEDIKKKEEDKKIKKKKEKEATDKKSTIENKKEKSTENSKPETKKEKTEQKSKDTKDSEKKKATKTKTKKKTAKEEKKEEPKKKKTEIKNKKTKTSEKKTKEEKKK